MSKAYPPRNPSTYVTPLPAGQSFEFVSAFTIFPYYGENFFPTDAYYLQIVYFNDQEVFRNEYKRYYLGGGSSGQNIGFTSKLGVGTYKVYYEIGTLNPYETPVSKATYRFSTIENKLPLKKYTVTDVVNRLCDLAEPIRRGEKQRFIWRKQE
ncbi:MAG: hypothetical protein K2L42_06645 [Clostridia bacterium]|nr:hypothetical protein [Clostridia bacterium]